MAISLRIPERKEKRDHTIEENGFRFTRSIVSLQLQPPLRTAQTCSSKLPGPASRVVRPTFPSPFLCTQQAPTTHPTFGDDATFNSNRPFLASREPLDWTPNLPAGDFPSSEIRPRPFHTSPLTQPGRGSWCQRPPGDHTLRSHTAPDSFFHLPCLTLWPSSTQTPDTGESRLVTARRHAGTQARRHTLPSTVPIPRRALKRRDLAFFCPTVANLPCLVSVYRPGLLVQETFAVRFVHSGDRLLITTRSLHSFLPFT